MLSTENRLVKQMPAKNAVVLHIKDMCVTCYCVWLEIPVLQSQECCDLNVICVSGV